jgi:WD40 repeat protein
VRFSKDGNKLVSSSNDKTLMIWSVETRKCLGKLTGHTGTVVNGFFFANDKMIASS